MAKSRLGLWGVLLLMAGGVMGAERELILCAFQEPVGTVTLGGEFPGAEGGFALHRDSDDAPWHGRLSYDLHQGAYVGVIVPATLCEGSGVVRFAVRVSNPNTRIHLKTTDEAKQEHIRHQTVPQPNVWTTLSFEVEKFSAAWHGPADKRIHWPVNLLQIGVERNPEYPVGTVDIADLRVRTTADAAAMPSLQVCCEPSRFGALFYPEESPTVRYSLKNRMPDTQGRYRTSLVLRDWQGVEICRRDSDEPLGLGETREAVFSPEQLDGRFGAFELTISVANLADAKDQQSASTWFGRLTSANPKPCSWLGTGIHSSHGWGRGDLRFIDILGAAGIGVVREEFGWSGIERRKGEYAVNEHTEDFVNRLNERGIRLNLLLTYGNPVYENPLDPNAYAAWCAFMAEHFQGRVDTFEIWNEPANFWFQKQYGGQRWGDAPWLGKFVELSLAAGAAIRQVQPKATVAVCAEDCWPTLKQMVEEGIGPAGNVLSIHPYCHGQPRPEREMFLKDDGRELRELSRQHGGPERVIITEVGWTTYAGDMEYLSIAGGYPRSSYVHQAQYLIRMYLTSRAAGADYALQYDFKNDGPRRNYTEHNFGLVHEDYTPKPSLTAVAYLTRLLGQAEYRGDLSADPLEYRLYHFVADGADVVVAYAIEGETELVLPKAMFHQLRLADLQGNPLPVRKDKGGLAITLTETPVYIWGLNVKKLGSRLAMDLETSGRDGILGETFAGRLHLTNHTGQTVKKAVCRWALTDAAGTELASDTVRLRLESPVADGADFVLPAVEIPFAGEKWQAQRGKRLRLAVTVEVNGVSIRRAQEFVLRDPVTVTLGNLVVRNGHSAMSVGLDYRGTQATTATLQATAQALPLAEFEFAVRFEPGQRQQLWLPLAATASLPAEVAVDLDLALPGGWRHTGRQSAFLAVVPRLADEPTLTGDWRQWQRALAVHQAPTEQSVVSMDPFRWNGADDLSASARLAWSDRGLYVGVLVRDDVFFQPYSNHGDVWKGDSIQVGLSAPSGSRFLELAVAKLPDRTQCLVYTTLDASLRDSDIPVSCRECGNGQWLYELCVPWQALPGVKPEPDAAFRFSLLVNDNDGQGRKGWLQFHSGIGVSKDANQHGYYTLGH